jgi:hypothetical protein
MENQRLRDCLDADFRRLREVAGSADPGAAVPSCPGWTMFVEYGTVTWPQYFAELLASADNRTVRVVAPDRSWLLHLTARDVRVDEPGAGNSSATLEGPAPEVLLWLWNRGGEGAATTGDAETITLLRKVLEASTQ